MKTIEKLEALRRLMKREGIDAYIVQSGDAHTSEYVCEHWKARQWASGFTGSTGTLVVTQKEAGLWTDGRYFIQAETELKDSTIKLQKMQTEGYPTVEEWLFENMGEGEVVGVDGRTVPVALYKKYLTNLRKKNVTLKLDVDLVGEIWADRPKQSWGKTFEHELCYAGKSRAEKLSEVRAEMKKEAVASYIITALEDIAWIYNYRGGDIEHLPVSFAFSFLTMDKAYLFIDETKLEPALKQNLLADGVILKSYEEAMDFFKSYDKPERIYLNPSTTNSLIVNSLSKKLEIAEGIDLTAKLKACKNEVEIKNIRNSQIKDGVAVAKFIKWVKEAVKTESIDEKDIHQKLIELRSEQELFMGASFSTIAAYMANAALAHYNPEVGESAKIQPKGFLLVDSGGQYLDGTTDMTRTIVVGEISDKMKKDYTLVLKSHISLAMAKFLYGTAGVNLDILARQPMWEHGIDYKHGTGHGIGYVLSVHEGPQSIGLTSPHVKLEKGMLLSNEPGIYRQGEWGIRTENTVLVVEDEVTQFGTFLKFETVAFCPFDLEAVDVSMLKCKEKEWLNNYHAQVYEKLSPHMNEEEQAWLKNETRAV